MAQSGEQGHEHLLRRAGSQKTSRPVRMEIDGKRAAQPPHPNCAASARAHLSPRLVGVWIFAPLPPYPPGVGQLGERAYHAPLGAMRPGARTCSPGESSLISASIKAH